MLLAAATIAVAEWLRSPSVLAAVAALLLLLITVARNRRTWLAVPLCATAIFVGAGQWSLNRLTSSWDGPNGERERRIQRASGRLEAELTEARLLADTLARRALAHATRSQGSGFDALRQLIHTDGLESGVAVFEPDGHPRIWGGRFRVAPSSTGDSAEVRLTPYYAVLEVRRHDSAGRTALGAVLLAADAAIPDGDRSLASRFRERTEVGLHLLAPADAPDISDVFDYELPTTAGPRVLFSVRILPPEQSEALTRAKRQAASRTTWMFLVALGVAIWLGSSVPLRLGLVLLPFVLALRAPLGEALGIGRWFDGSFFSSPVLGPLSSSAGPLLLCGMGLILAGRLLRGKPTPRWFGIPLAGLILFFAPFLLFSLGKGIVPPSGGVPMGAWLIWQLSLFFFAAGLLWVALGAIRGAEDAARSWAPALAASLLACGSGLTGLLIWQPVSGWPGWYLVCWLATLLPLLRPATRRADLIAVAIVAGTGASLLAWSADREGKVRAARADMSRLAEVPDQELEGLLRTWGRSLQQVNPPQTASDLYALWQASMLDPGQPVTFGRWTAEGIQELDLPLDQLDVPDEVIGSEVRAMSPNTSVLVRTLDREPAPHHLLLVRLDTTAVLSVVLGPPTALIRPTRLGRLLGVRGSGSPPYRLTLAPTPSVRAMGVDSGSWRREGPLVLGQRTIAVAGTPREVNGTIEVGEPTSLVVRGGLVLMLDLGLLALWWMLAGWLAGRSVQWPEWIPRIRSYEARIGFALAIFFLAPTLGFAAWGIGRLRNEVRASRDRSIEQTLRDALPSRAELPVTEPDKSAALQDLSGRMDADFALYRDARLVGGTTGELLQTLGLVDLLLDPVVFQRILVDGAQVTTGEGPSRAIDLRVGYRAVRLADLEGGVLAMPQSGADPLLPDRQRDLTLLLFLLTILGIGASLLAAHAAARALSRPVAQLKEAALAFGKGREVTLPAENPAAEFAPVFDAFARMTKDIRKSRDAQERVARIVAWGELANQVAHEIKNPLTPMRLGVQHLRRVYEDGHTPLGPVLESTTARILAEIDRLDRIARSFSRFGMPAAERGPLETVKLPSLIRDVAELYRLGPEGAEVVVEVEGAEPAAARPDEVKEALVNLLENSRNAGARTIRVRVVGTMIAVEDDGRGIPASLLPMIFEPRFSTSTSGSGLGLPIVKRLVEGWGGKVEVESSEGRGTVVRLLLARPVSAGPGPAI